MARHEVLTWDLRTSSRHADLQEWLVEAALDPVSLVCTPESRLATLELVVEGREEARVHGSFLWMPIRCTPLFRYRLTAENVMYASATHEEGTVELFVKDVLVRPNAVVLQCANGTVELHGQVSRVRAQWIGVEDYEHHTWKGFTWCARCSPP